MHLSWSAGLLAFLACLAPLFAQSPSGPPVAKQIEHISVWHGEKVNDPYFWLREKSNPEVIKYLEAENAYTEATTKGPAAIRRAALPRDARPHQADRPDVPVRRGDYFYYSRTEEGKQYPIRCRKKAAAGRRLRRRRRRRSPARRERAGQGPQVPPVGSFEVSDDAHLLAYTADTTGFRQYRLYVKDLRTGAILPDSAERVTSVEWCADNRTLFYTTEDPVTKRSNMVWRHALGDETEPVYEEKDELFTSASGRSKDQKMLFLRSTSTDTYEVRYLPSDQPERHVSGRASAGERATSTTSSTATGSSTSAPTTTPRTSAW